MTLERELVVHAHPWLRPGDRHRRRVRGLLELGVGARLRLAVAGRALTARDAHVAETGYRWDDTAKRMVRRGAEETGT